MSTTRRYETKTFVLSLACAFAILMASAALIAQTKSDEKPAADKDDAVSSEKTPASQSTEDAGDKKGDKKDRSKNPEPRRDLSASEILKELQKDTRDTPVTPPQTPTKRRSSTVSTEATPPGAIRPASRKLLPDGSRLVDRPGRLTREGDYFTYSFESRGQGQPELPIRLLPNRLLEDMEIVSAGGTRPIVFVVSGEVTEYRGVNYLLVQKMLVRPNLGNLK